MGMPTFRKKNIKSERDELMSTSIARKIYKGRRA
jgi:hypothetical protein